VLNNKRPFQETNQILNKFGKYVIQQSRSNLTRTKKNVNKTLYDSLTYFIDKTKNGFRFDFEMEDYGMYQDRGVSGTKTKYDTPFKYTNKKPPLDPLIAWAKARNIRLRDENGIKPSMFFTTPFQRAFKNLPDDLLDGFADDIQNFFKDK
jgi:hypothetical protein